MPIYPTLGQSVVLALAITASSVGAATADVTIGVLTPLSGKGASYGQQQKNAIAMFLEKYGDIGGPAGKLQLVTYDTRGDNAEAINLTRKLIDSDQVLAIIGPQFSGEAEVSFPLAVRGQTPIITPMAAKAGITAANRPWAFRFALTTEKVYGPLLDAWLKKQSGLKANQRRCDFCRFEGRGLELRCQDSLSAAAKRARHQGGRYNLLPNRRHRFLRPGDARQEPRAGRRDRFLAFQRSRACG